jgi:hypothetical protein
VIEQSNLGAPKIGKALCPHDPVESILVDVVKDFAEVKFKDSGRHNALVTCLKDVSGIDEVLRNRPPRDEPGLIWMDEIGDEVPEA